MQDFPYKEKNKVIDCALCLYFRSTLLCSGRFLASAIVEKDSWKRCIWWPGNATQQSSIPLRNSLTAALNDDLKNTDWQILRIPLFVLGWEQKSQRHISKKKKNGQMKQKLCMALMENYLYSNCTGLISILCLPPPFNTQCILISRRINVHTCILIHVG